jgi:hypothetical protein
LRIEVSRPCNRKKSQERGTELSGAFTELETPGASEILLGIELTGFQARDATEELPGN